MINAGLTADDVIDLLGLVPLPAEGGYWAQTWLDAHGSGIYFLMRPGDFSAMHRLRGPELWHHYAGDPVTLLLLGPDDDAPSTDAGNTVERRVLGDDLKADQRPFAAVAPGVWMGAATTGDWSLVGTTMAPAFDAADFELGDRAALQERYPEAAAEIAALTRLESP